MMRVLISGASVAGPTAAYWLARYGFRPTVVERAPGPRAGGYPIDLRGPAVDIAERMGILPKLMAARVNLTTLSFVDRAGRRRGGVDMRALRDALPSPEIEVPRGDLVRVLHEATADDVEYRYDDSISELTPDQDGVTVRFASGATDRYDLVLGADGLHSNTRRLAFGDEAPFLRHLGYCVAAADVPKDPRQRGDTVVLHNTPGRMVGVYDYLDRATAIFVFRHPVPPRDLGRQKDVLAAAFADGSWRVPELLRQVIEAPDFYFDSVSQIRMPSWSAGRVSLLGDAAHCPALLSGQGTTLAMAGAYTLAGELHRAGGDHLAAFGRYERIHRPLASAGQRRASSGARQLVPSTNHGIRLRDLLSPLWVVPVAAAPLLRRLRHTAAPVADYRAVSAVR